MRMLFVILILRLLFLDQNTDVKVSGISEWLYCPEVLNAQAIVLSI